MHFYQFLLFSFLLIHGSYIPACNAQGLTDSPTKMPTDFAVPTSNPTRRPTKLPTSKPSKAPTTRSPTTSIPTTAFPTTTGPTIAPTTTQPSTSPTESPTKTRRPSKSPTLSPTASPVITSKPTKEPTFNDCENYQGVWYDDANKIYLDCKSGYRCGKDISLVSFCFLEGIQTRTQLCAANNAICFRNSDCPSGQKCLKEDFCGTGRCFQYDDSNITPYPTKKPTSTPTTKSPTLNPTRKPSQTPTTFIPTLSPSPGNKTESPTTAIPTKNPTLQVSQSDLLIWQTFYDSAGGSTWTSCQNSRDYPCACNDRVNLRYVVCESVTGSSQSSGRLLESLRDLQASGEIRITEIRLRNNNVKGSAASMPLSKLPYLKVIDFSSDLNSATPNNIQSTGVTDCKEFSYCYVPGIRCEFEGSGSDLCLKDWGIDPKYVLFAAGTSMGAIVICCCCYFTRRTTIKRRKRNAAKYIDDEEEGEPEENNDAEAAMESPKSPAKAKSPRSFKFGEDKRLGSNGGEEESLLPAAIKRKKSLIRTASSKRLSTSERQRFKRVESLYEVGMLSNEEVLELVPDFFDIQAHSNIYTRKSSVRWVDKEGEKVPAGPISQVIKITDYENESKGTDSVPVPLDSDEILSTFRFHDESQPHAELVSPSLEEVRRVDLETPKTNPKNDIFGPDHVEKEQTNDTKSNNNNNPELDSSDEEDMNQSAVESNPDLVPEIPQFRVTAQRRASNTSSISSIASSTVVMSESEIVALAEKAQTSGEMVPEDKRPPISKIQFMLENDVLTAEQASYICPEFLHLRPAPPPSPPSRPPPPVPQMPEPTKRPSNASVASENANTKPKEERSNSLIQQALSILGIDEKAVRRKSLSKQLERKRKLDIILSNQEVFTSFIDEHSRFFKAEHVLFWNSVDRFEKYRSLAARNRKAYQDMAQTVIDDFIKDGAPNLVILSDDVKDKILSKRPEQFTPELFVEAKREVMSAMNIDFLAMMEKSSDADTLDEIIDQFEILVEDIEEKKKAESINKEIEETVLPEGAMEKHDDDARVDILMGMGFTKRQSMRSLKAHDGDVDAAAQDLILNSGNAGDDDDGSVDDAKPKPAKSSAAPVDALQSSAKPITAVIATNPQESTPVIGAATSKSDAQAPKLQVQSSATQSVAQGEQRARSRTASIIPVPPAVPASLPQALVALANSISRRNTLTRDESNDNDSSDSDDEKPEPKEKEEEEGTNDDPDPYDIDRFRTPSFDGHDIPRLSSPSTPTSVTAAQILRMRSEDKSTIGTSSKLPGSMVRENTDEDEVDDDEKDIQVDVKPSAQKSQTTSMKPASLPAPPAVTKAAPATVSTNAQTTSIPAGKVSSIAQNFSAAAKPPAPPPPPPPPGLLPSNKNANISTISTNNTVASITPKPPAPPSNANLPTPKPAATTTTVAVSATPSTQNATKKQLEPPKPPQQQATKPAALNIAAINGQATNDVPPSPVAAAIKRFSAATPATSTTGTTTTTQTQNTAKPAPKPSITATTTPTANNTSTSNTSIAKPASKPSITLATANTPATAPKSAATTATTLTKEPARSGSVTNAIQSLQAKQTASSSNAATSTAPVRSGSVSNAIQAFQSKQNTPAATPAPTGPSPSIAARIRTLSEVSQHSYVDQPPMQTSSFDYGNNAYPQQQQQQMQQPYYDPNQAYYDPNQYGNVQQGYSQAYYDPNQQQQQQYSADYYQNSQYGSDPYNGGYQHGYHQSFDSGFYGADGQNMFEREAYSSSSGLFGTGEHQPRSSGAKPAHIRAKEGVVSKQKQYFLEKQAQLAGSSRRLSKDPNAQGSSRGSWRQQR